MTPRPHVRAGLALAARLLAAAAALVVAAIPFALLLLRVLHLGRLAGLDGRVHFPCVTRTLNQLGA